jgi:hypothetical protein
MGLEVAVKGAWFGLEAWLKQYSACPANMKPLIQTPVLQKKKKKDRVAT